MDHKTRVWNAIRFEPVDRVPFDLFDEAGYLFSEGLYDPGQRLYLSLAEQVEARIRFHRVFDTDLIFDTPVLGEGAVPYKVHLTPQYAERYELLFATFPLTAGLWHPWPPHIRPRPDVNPAQDKQIDLFVEWKNGLSCNLHVETVSGTSSGYEMLMHSREEWPLWREAFTPRLEAFDYTYVDRIVEATNGDVALYGTIAGPYSTFAALFGLQESTYLLYDEPTFAAEVLDWCTDVAIEVGIDLIRHGVDLLRIGEATASLISPPLYEKHVLARHRRMNRALTKAGGAPILHLCGKANQLLPSLAAAEPAGVEPLTPCPLGNIDLREAKETVGNRVCLKGNLDPVHVVGGVGRDRVAAETHRCLQVAAHGGGYILSVADCLTPGTPLENLEIIAQIVHESSPE